jgi:hypothetical protein
MTSRVLLWSKKRDQAIAIAMRVAGVPKKGGKKK